MEGSSTSNCPPSRVDPFAQPFRLLRIDPTATTAQVKAAWALALEQRAAPDDVLAEVRSIILDPARRLACELTYPIDSAPEQIETFYAELASNTPEPMLLVVADRLAPLSRANFVAHLAARRSAESAVLLALVYAHASVDVTEIYATLKTLRNRASFPTPSLVGVSNGLHQLFAIHAAAAIAGYDTVQNAAATLLECTQRVLAGGEPYRVEALARLVHAYRQSTAILRSNTDRRIDTACQSLQQGSDDASSIDELADALRLSMSLCRPLILLDAYQGNRDRDLEIAVDLVRLLLFKLSANQRYETARKIVNLSRDVFSLLPGVVKLFNEAADLLQKLSIEAELKPLRDLIEQFDRDSTMLVKAVDTSGFGEQSSEEARNLWQAFCQAVKATHSSEFSDQPWMLTRNLALRLGTRPDSATVASRLIAGLIRHGQDLSANPVMLNTFRNDLSHIEREHRAKVPTKARVRRRFAKRTLVVCSVLVGIVFTFVAYRNFDGASLRFLIPAQYRFSVQALKMSEPEILPPIGKGQHFALEYVRYCHFQEERLRIIKQEVRGPEDFHAYNALANDYNSRCSDFFYQDNDLKIVTDEVNAKRKILEADAKRILATWSWHTASGSTSVSPVK